MLCCTSASAVLGQRSPCQSTTAYPGVALKPATRNMAYCRSLPRLHVVAQATAAAPKSVDEVQTRAQQQHLAKQFAKRIPDNDIDFHIHMQTTNRWNLPVWAFENVPISSLLLFSHCPQFAAQLSDQHNTAAAKCASHSTGPASIADKQLSGSQRTSVELTTGDMQEFHAVKHCLRFMYSGKLLQRLSVAELHTTYCTAQRMQMEACRQACLCAATAISSKSAKGRLDFDDIRDIYKRQAVQKQHMPEAFHLLVTKALLRLFPSVPTAMHSKELRAQWCSLPHAALLDLVHSESLATDSEDSVLTAVSVWADANQPCKRQSRALLEAVRLLQLSRAFFCTVLPQLEWVQRSEAVHPADLLRLAAYAGADEKGRGLYTDTTSCSLPAAWLTTGPRPVDSMATKEDASIKRVVSFSRSQIQGLLSQLQKAQEEGKGISTASALVHADESKRFFAHGVKVGPSLR